MAPKTGKVMKWALAYLSKYPNEDFMAKEIAAGIKYDVKLTRRALDRLVAHGQVQRNNGIYCYRPGATQVETVEREPQVEVDIPEVHHGRKGAGIDIERVVELRKTMRMDEIAEELGTSTAAMYRHLRKAGVKLGKGGGPFPSARRYKQVKKKPKSQPEPVPVQGISLLMFSAENTFKFQASLTLEQAEAVACTVINPPQEEE